jgi:hypothetical protein
MIARLGQSREVRAASVLKRSAKAVDQQTTVRILQNWDKSSVSTQGPLWVNWCSRAVMVNLPGGYLYAHTLPLLAL